MPERHHYVPRLLLSGFSREQKIWLFDKHTNKAFQTNIVNAFVEGDFNTVSGDNFKIEGEDFFGSVETAAAPIVRELRAKSEVRNLSNDEIATLATFVALQHLRSKQSRRFFSIFREEIQRRFPGIPQSQFDLPGFAPAEADKFASLDFISNALSDITKHILDKDLLIVEVGETQSFWISDHPVILNNDNPSSPYRSNLGFGVNGIQIYLPISSTQAVAFFCPSIKLEMEAGLKNIADKLAAAFTGRRIVNAAGQEVRIEELQRMKQNLTDRFCDMYKNKKARFNADNTIFFNSAQLRTAHRFIASIENDFALALEMLETHPELRNQNLIQFG
jgi:hypothetical protein